MTLQIAMAQNPVPWWTPKTLQNKTTIGTHGRVTIPNEVITLGFDPAIWTSPTFCPPSALLAHFRLAGSKSDRGLPKAARYGGHGFEVLKAKNDDIMISWKRLKPQRKPLASPGSNVFFALTWKHIRRTWKERLKCHERHSHFEGSFMVSISKPSSWWLE